MTLCLTKALLLTSVAGLSTTLFAAPALAQTTDGDQDTSSFEATGESPGFGEIVVTARRQEETLQEVPVTVTAIGGETLDRYQLNEVQDLQSQVPSLNVQVGGSGSGGQLSLRGVGSSNISASFDSAVAFDFDGVQVSTMRIVQAGFFDVAQIDVLKGPQSLFFGKSASAGVLSVRSADPTNDWTAGFSGSYEFEEQGYTVDGFISGPLSNNLGIRLAAQYQDIDRYVELAPNTPAQNLERGLENLFLRGTLQWDPVDNFSMNLKLNYVSVANDGAVGNDDIFCGANGVADSVFLFGGAVQLPSNADCNAFDQLSHTSDPHPALNTLPAFSAGADRFNSNGGVPFGETEIFFGRLRWDMGLTDDLTLTSTTGFLDLDALDIDGYSYVGIPGTAGASDPENLTEQYTQELRLTSDFAGPFNFMVGAFYETRDIDFNTSQQAVNISLLAGPDPVTGSTFDYTKRHRTETSAWSVFGSATIDITDRLQLSGGLRYSDESKVNTINVPYVHAVLAASPAFISGGFNSGPINFSDNNFSPEVSLRYELADDVFIYGAYKTGFKSGGIDNSALPSNSLLGFSDPDPAVRQAVADALIYQSETSQGGEIGFRSLLAGRTVTLNASAFYYIFDDLQVQNFDAATVQFQTFNASQLTTRGVDIEAAWDTPVDGLILNASLAFTDAYYSASFVTTSGEDIEGREAARAPDFAGNVGFNWDIPIGSALQFGLGGNAAFSTSYFTNEDSTADFRDNGFVTFDASVSIGDQDDLWELSLVGRNITDEVITSTSGGRPFLPPGGDDLILTQNRGRLLFVRGTVRF